MWTSLCRFKTFKMLRNVSFDCIFYGGTSVRETSSSQREPIHQWAVLEVARLVYLHCMWRRVGFEREIEASQKAIKSLRTTQEIVAKWTLFIYNPGQKVTGQNTKWLRQCTCLFYTSISSLHNLIQALVVIFRNPPPPRNVGSCWDPSGCT